MDERYLSNLTNIIGPYQSRLLRAYGVVGFAFFFFLFNLLHMLIHSFIHSRRDGKGVVVPMKWRKGGRDGNCI